MAALERWRGCSWGYLLLLGRKKCLHASQPALPALRPAPAQVTEELAAAEARRQAVIAAQPALRLALPEALQQAPPRLDMCSECAQMVQQVGRAG